MSDYHQLCDKMKRAVVCSLNIRPGDFISYGLFKYSYCWNEVSEVWADDPDWGSCLVHSYRNPRGTEYVHFTQINYVHRKNDPWDERECCFMDDSTGQYSNYMGSERQGYLPLPDKYLYQGTYSIKPWLWNYCGRNVAPKTEQNLQPFLELAGVPGNNVPWNEAGAICRKLEEKRIRGWFPHCRPVPEQTFGKAISIKQLADRLWKANFSLIPDTKWANYTAAYLT
jgi:hypothetical protein